MRRNYVDLRGHHGGVGYRRIGAFIAYRDKNEDKAVSSFLKIMVALYTIVNIIVFVPSWLTANVNQEYRAPYAEAAEYFGLKSGVEYPLNLGSRISGTSGQSSVSGNWFYVYGEGSWTPATTLSLGFQSNSGRSWILEVPVSRVTFIQDADADPSVKITLRGDTRGLGFNMKKTNPGCDVKVLAGWWVCIPPDEPLYTLSASDDAERAGLAPVLAQAFAEGNASAEITLTPKQYNALLNS